jgi:hypothetical protein
LDRHARSVVTAFVCALAVSGCPAPPTPEGTLPPRPAGCDVKVYPEAPSGQTDNVGPVSASCDESVSDDDCLRTLKDQACKLGADIVWGLEPNPTKQNGKKKFFGRAAHTRTNPK